ncbi:MAG: DUF86 domain-containing protein [Defluviitaleaceae bacterium]|nr:DUF86 domain-containing protein [Defluviitaleaceae bacterium]
MRGLRNRLVHDYDGVNLELVWDVVNYVHTQEKKGCHVMT